MSRAERIYRDPPAIAMRYLLPDEDSVITIRQHWAKLLPALAVAAGGLLAAVAVNGISAGWAHLLVWLLAALLMARALVDVLSRSVQYIVVTKRRLVLTSGLLGRKVTLVPLSSLKDLAFTRSAGGRLLRYGAFTFAAGGQSRAVIDYIPEPERVYLEIYGYLFPQDPGIDGYRADRDFDG